MVIERDCSSIFAEKLSQSKQLVFVKSGNDKVSPDVEQQYQYTEPTKCINPACQNTRDWELDMQASEICAITELFVATLAFPRGVLVLAASREAWFSFD